MGKGKRNLTALASTPKQAPKSKKTREDKLADSLKEGNSGMEDSFNDAPSPSTEMSGVFGGAFGNTESITNIETVVQGVLTRILPEIQNTIQNAVKDALVNFNLRMEKIETKMISKMQQIALIAKYDNDQLQQYGRRENFRVFGIPEDNGENEDTDAKVINIAQLIGASIKPGDISVSHRLGKKPISTNSDPANPRPIICKMTNRNAKQRIFQNKKKLKEPEVINKIGYKTFITEDLTPLRSKLLRKCKSATGVKAVFTINGTINCIMNNDKKISVETPDDLWKLGFEDIDYNELGLQHYVNGASGQISIE